MSKTGRSRIESAFAKVQGKRAALMPYFTLGYPDIESSLSIIEAIGQDSDLLELGMPFSDPIADGPTIQRSTQRALANGVTLARCLKMLRCLRERGLEVPALLMGYYNPILAYGEERFAADAAESGADGLIIPDLPPEESSRLAESCEAVGLALIQFLAPTSCQSRQTAAVALASGFIYAVSVTGVTGARKALPERLPAFVSGLRTTTELPIAVGFGVSSPELAASVGAYADGVIVGSALIDIVDRAVYKPDAARLFVRKLAQALAMETT